MTYIVLKAPLNSNQPTNQPSPTPKFSHWKTLPALPHRRYITDSRKTSACGM